MLQGIADMSTNLPIVRDTRVRDRLATAGQTVFTFDAPLFDAADLKVFVQAAPGAPFIERVTGFTVALLEDNAGGEVAFAAPPLAVGGAGPTVVRLKGQRTHERLTDVTRGGVVRSVSLEAEFDRAAVVLQELRRDVDAVVGAVDQVVETVAGAVETVTSTAAAIVETAAIVNTKADDAADAAGLADRLANEAPGTPVGAGYSARHWAAYAEYLAGSLDLANYSTTAQIYSALENYVLKALLVVGGLGVKVNGGLNANLSSTLTISLDLSEKALAQSVWTAGVSAVEAPISPEKLKATIAALMPALPAGLKGVQVITASGTYNPTPGATKALVLATGGGAGGVVDNNTVAGGGGGAGATVIGFLDAATTPVVVGAGGANGGNAGGTTTFGTLSAGGGASLSSGTGGAGGLGGTGSGGILAIPGGDGASARTSGSTAGGHGGSSFWGGGGRGGSGATGAAQTGKAYGSGGGSGSNASGNSGAYGAGGVVLVLEF
jgi:hypothetical protein